MCFFLSFVYVVDYIDEFLYVEQSPHLWDEAYLVMVDDFSDLFLDSICQCFEYFCIYVHEKNWSVIIFLSCVFVGLGHRGCCLLVKGFGNVPCVSIVWNNLRSIGISSSLNIW